MEEVKEMFTKILVEELRKIGETMEETMEEIERIKRIVREKIVDPLVIKNSTISCGIMKILLTEGAMFTKGELETILNNTWFFFEEVKDNIKPIEGTPEVKIYLNGKVPVLLINGNCRWQWK